MWLTRYIHRQAVKKGMVCDPKDYPWTSYLVYVGMERNSYINNTLIIDQFGKGKKAFQNYRNFVMDNDDGPIDWSLIERDNKNNENEIEEVIKKLIGNINKEAIMNPIGLKEKRERHQLIMQLIKQHKFRVVDVAKYFKIGKGTVSKIVK